METITPKELRTEHERLRADLRHVRAAARELPDLPPDERSLLIARVLDFLRGTLIPHATAEERGLCAEVRRVLGDPRVTDTMAYEHEAIEHMTDALASTPVQWTEQLQELLYGIAALIEVHFQKEERIYLELVEKANAAEEPVPIHEP
ncbi:MAG: hemerythrin domain-containing protein [Gaiellaceae bacterium]